VREEVFGFFYAVSIVVLFLASAVLSFLFFLDRSMVFHVLLLCSLRVIWLNDRCSSSYLFVPAGESFHLVRFVICI
jgi:hypothetical protein